MAIDINTKVKAALFTHLDALVLVPALEIAWPDQEFTPPQDSGTNRPAAYLRVTYVPNAPDRRFIGSTDPHMHMGLMQVSVMYPKDKSEAGMAIADKIAQHFAADTQLYSGDIRVRITQKPEVTPSIPESSARVQTPVMIPWECWG